jgi:hypothetical protein
LFEVDIRRELGSEISDMRVEPCHVTLPFSPKNPQLVCLILA